MREAVSFKNQLGRVKFSWPPRIPRRTITTAFVSTLSVAGLGWLVFGHEPFASKLEPVTSAIKKMMRGGRVPIVPTENNERVIPVDPKWSKTLCHFQGSRRAGGLNSSIRAVDALVASIPRTVIPPTAQRSTRGVQPNGEIRTVIPPTAHRSTRGVQPNGELRTKVRIWCFQLLLRLYNQPKKLDLPVPLDLDLTWRRGYESGGGDTGSVAYFVVAYTEAFVSSASSTCNTCIHTCN